MLDAIFKFLAGGEDDYAYYLLEVSRRGNLNHVKSLLADPNILNVAAAENNEALIAAARNGHTEVVRELMKVKVVSDMEQDPLNVNCALKEAAEYGRTDVFMVLLENPEVKEKFMKHDLNVLKLALARRATEIVIKALTSPAVIKIVTENSKEYLRAADLSGRNNYLEAIFEVLPEQEREKAITHYVNAKHEDMLSQFKISIEPKGKAAAPVNQKNVNGKRAEPS